MQTTSVLLALVILAHAWSSRITAPPVVLSVIGWTINVLAAFALASVWLR